MPVNIGSLEFDATINFDAIAKQSAEALGEEIKKGIAAGTEAAKAQENVIFEIIDTYKQLGDIVGRTYDVSKESFSKLSDAEIARQEEWLRMAEFRGQVMTKEQSEWLDMAEERRQKLRDEVELSMSRNIDESSGQTPQPGRAPAGILGSDFTNTLQDAYNALNDLDKTSQRFYNNIGKTEQRLIEVKAAQKALNTEQVAGRLTTDQYQKAYASLAAQEEILINTIDVLTQSQKAHQASMGVENGSIAQKKALLSELYEQYENVGSAEFKTSDAGKQMLKSIQDLKAEIDALNPENLSEAGDKAIQAYSRLRQLKNELATMHPSDPGYAKTLEEATLLENRLKNVNNELKFGGSNTAGLDATTQALRGVIGGFTALQGVIGLLTDDNKELQKTLLTVTSAMSVLQGVQEFSSAIAKAGGLNQYLLSIFMRGTTKAAEEQIVATTALTGVQEVQKEVAGANVVVAEATAIAAGEIAVAEGAQAVATTAATGALERLTAAMAANPATVLIVALTAIIAAIYTFVSSSKDANEEQLKLNETLAAANELLAKLAELYNEVYRDASVAAENAVSLATAQGKSEMHILNLRKKALEAKREENLAMLTSLKMGDAQTKAFDNHLSVMKVKLELEREDALLLEKKKELAGKLSKEDETQLALLNSNIKLWETKYNLVKGLANSIADTNAKVKDLDAEKTKKIHDDSLKSDASLAEARYTLAAKNTKASLDAELAAIETRRKVELNDPNLTPGAKEDINAKAKKAVIDANRQYAILQLNDDKSLLQSQLNLAEKGSALELDIKRKLVNKQAEIDQKAEGITAAKGKEIRSNARKANEDLDRQFRIKQLSDDKSLIKADIAAVKEGSARELQLKQDLINKQLEIDEAAEGVSHDRKIELEADAQKAIGELVKKFAQDNSRSDILTKISIIDDQLAIVEKGSEKELQLKKDLIDQKAALEAVSAETTIKNETELSAKIKSIFSKASVDKRKEENDFSDRNVDESIKKIESDANKLKIPLQKILGSPFSSAGEEYRAQLQILQIDLQTYTAKQKKFQEQILAGTGDVSKAKQAFKDLGVMIELANDSIGNLRAKRIFDIFGDIAGDIMQISQALSSLSSAVESTNAGLSDTLATMSEMASMASDLASAMSSFATGNIVGGIVSTIKLIVSLFSMGDKARESERKAMDEIQKYQLQILAGEIETNIQYRERLRIQVLINKTKLQGLKDEADILSKQRKDSLSEYTRIFGLLQSESFVSGKHTEKYGGFLGIGRKTRAIQDLASLAGKSFDDLQKLFNTGQLTDHAKELFQELQKLKQEGADIDQQLLDIQKQTRELYTGTTADSISDSIVEGFKSGYRTASDFADTFEQLMRDAVFNSLKFKTLEPALKDFYNQFADFSQSGDVLTAAEIETLKNVYRDIIDKTNKEFQNLSQITNMNLSGSGDGNSLKGAIKGITEQQAQLLAGQFGAQRLTLLDILNINSQSLKELQYITYNTSFIEQSHRIFRDWQINGIKMK